MDEQRYPNLKYLFSGYFNQDWLYMRLDDLGLSDNQIDGNTSFEYNMQLFTNGSKHRIVDAIGELENLIELNLNESELRNFLLEKLGSYVYAPSLGMTYKLFLQAVLRLLKENEPEAE